MHTTMITFYMYQITSFRGFASTLMKLLWVPIVHYIGDTNNRTVYEKLLKYGATPSSGSLLGKLIMEM